jgi:uncharacterized protein YsxB (DUF464 family)
MVNVEIHNKGSEAHISITGHAEYNPGNDIVCSAISGLGYAFLGAVQNYQISNPKLFDLKYNANSGEIECSIKNIIPHAKVVLNAYISMLTVGLQQIELQYPDNINVHLE